jgi:hypothetical protein
MEAALDTGVSSLTLPSLPCTIKQSEGQPQTGKQRLNVSLLR